MVIFLSVITDMPNFDDLSGPLKEVEGFELGAAKALIMERISKIWEQLYCIDCFIPGIQSITK